VFLEEEVNFHLVVQKLEAVFGYGETTMNGIVVVDLRMREQVQRGTSCHRGDGIHRCLERRRNMLDGFERKDDVRL
jgi:hypothetical protein